MAAISRRKSTASGIEVMLWFVALPLMYYVISFAYYGGVDIIRGNMLRAIASP
ncbi:hypothetical protein QTP88_018184 [Uroleucon formosanum]